MEHLTGNTTTQRIGKPMTCPRCKGKTLKIEVQSKLYDLVKECQVCKGKGFIFNYGEAKK